MLETTFHRAHGVLAGYNHYLIACGQFSRIDRSKNLTNQNPILPILKSLAVIARAAQGYVSFSLTNTQLSRELTGSTRTHIELREHVHQGHAFLSRELSWDLGKAATRSMAAKNAVFMVQPNFRLRCTYRFTDTPDCLPVLRSHAAESHVDFIIQSRAIDHHPHNSFPLAFTTVGLLGSAD
jgi:hypothetical protein